MACCGLLLALAYALVAGSVFAQTPTVVPSELRQQGGQLERLQREREEVRRGLLQSAPKAQRSPAAEAISPWPALESPCLPIHEIVLVGDSSESFKWALDELISGADPAIGSCLGVGGVTVAVERAQQSLIARGFMTSRIVFEAQDLASGRLTLGVILGRVRVIRLALFNTRANEWSAVPLQFGDILSLRYAEQAPESFDCVPTDHADIQIDLPDARCQCDLIIRRLQSLPFRLNVTLDDGGSKSACRYHGGSLSDAWAAEGCVIHYLPSFDHWLLGFTRWASGYLQRVAGVTQDYVYRDQHNSAEIKLAHPAYCNASPKTTASLKDWLRNSKKAIDDTDVQTQRRAIGGFMGGLSYKNFVGSAAHYPNLSPKRCTGALSAVLATMEAFDEGASRMRIGKLDVNWSVPFTLASWKSRDGGTLKVQLNDTRLKPHDRFASGGRYALRDDLDGALADSGREAYLSLGCRALSGSTPPQYLTASHLAGAVLDVRSNFRQLSYDVFVDKHANGLEYFRTASSTAGPTLPTYF